MSEANIAHSRSRERESAELNESCDALQVAISGVLVSESTKAAHPKYLGPTASTSQFRQSGESWGGTLRTRNSPAWAPLHCQS